MEAQKVALSTGNNLHNHQHHHEEEDTESNESHAAQQNVNVKAAMIHVIGDTIQSVGVIIAALIIYFLGNTYAIVDPICTFLFSILVVFTTIPIAKDCVIVLMEGSPLNLEPDEF